MFQTYVGQLYVGQICRAWVSPSKEIFLPCVSHYFVWPLIYFKRPPLINKWLQLMFIHHTQEAFVEIFPGYSRQFYPQLKRYKSCKKACISNIFILCFSTTLVSRTAAVTQWSLTSSGKTPNATNLQGMFAQIKWMSVDFWRHFRLGELINCVKCKDSNCAFNETDTDVSQSQFKSPTQHYFIVFLLWQKLHKSR